ncbi:MAG: tRNA preQ1(34) S-adenosylmethionine ribosyltransferase-isomerase QueA [Acidobacteria bacterium]|nr:tRNA preQ1(34) S-adenosylmethionine ribosyltransferase-isomerase QueA [Acidobacteriota bacterium]
MRISDFDFELPEKLIAQEPATRRDASRLLVVNRASRTFTDAVFNQLPDFLRPSDLLVLNNTRVFPARLLGHRIRENEGGEKLVGAKVEVFLVQEVEPLIWETLVRPGKALHEGAKIEFANGQLSAEVLAWHAQGRRLIRFHCAGDFQATLDDIGRTPLPPYIKREAETRLDQERYQTVYASERGAIAAPTAGLHFTPQLLAHLTTQGIATTEITLHVGYGTFQPVKVERLEEHRVEAERFSISEPAAHQINQALNAQRRVIAVGTTTTRALESAARSQESEARSQESEVRCLESGVRNQESEETDLLNEFPSLPHSPMPRLAVSPVVLQSTDLFIYPGFEFRVLSGLITNFHLPRSSLLVLVSAFAGRELILAAYRHAVKNGYRFYSYGDAMLIL